MVVLDIVFRKLRDEERAEDRWKDAPGKCGVSFVPALGKEICCKLVYNLESYHSDHSRGFFDACSYPDHANNGRVIVKRPQLLSTPSPSHNYNGVVVRQLDVLRAISKELLHFRVSDTVVKELFAHVYHGERRMRAAGEFRLRSPAQREISGESNFPSTAFPTRIVTCQIAPPGTMTQVLSESNLANFTARVILRLENSTGLSLPGKEDFLNLSLWIKNQGSRHSCFDRGLVHRSHRLPGPPERQVSTGQEIRPC